MTGLFGTLNTATGGMRAQQNALQTTGHNLSNINTPGYSRQRVSMKTAFPQSMAGIGQIGTGVEISGITRITDDYVTRQLENELSSLIEHGNISEVLGQLEGIFNEPSDTGINQQVSKFFAAWGSLGEDPTSAGKTLVISQTETLVDTIKHISNKIESLATDTIGQIKKDVLDFNSAAQQLKNVNDQIFQAKVKGEEPNDLMDTQDQLIGHLKSIADVDIKKDQYGRVSVSFGDKDIVTSTNVTEIAVGNNGKIYHDVDPADIGSDGYVVDKPAQQRDELEMTRGSIKGFQKAHETVLKKEVELDNFVHNFATAVNAIATKGSKADDGTTIPPAIDGKDYNFFVNANQGGKFTAKDLKINQDLLDDPSSLVTGAAFDNSVSGDGTRAKAIAELVNISLEFENNGNLKNDFKDGSLSLESSNNGSPLSGQYNEIITDMGIIKQQADNMMANQGDLVALLDKRKASISGVDMNEEVVNMIQFQSAFQANARMISVINEMLDTLINRTGV